MSQFIAQVAEMAGTLVNSDDIGAALGTIAFCVVGASMFAVVFAGAA